MLFGHLGEVWSCGLGESQGWKQDTLQAKVMDKKGLQSEGGQEEGRGEMRLWGQVRVSPMAHI